MNQEEVQDRKINTASMTAHFKLKGSSAKIISRMVYTAVMSVYAKLEGVVQKLRGKCQKCKMSNNEYNLRVVVTRYCMYNVFKMQ